MPTRSVRPRRTALLIAGFVGGAGAGAAGLAALALLLGLGTLSRSACDPQGGGPAAALPASGGAIVGASEYGGPGDPSSGITGARGDDLRLHPDTYAELGGTTWQTATAMGGLAYLAPLRISWGRRSGIAYKRDFGLGGGPVAGRQRVIDLWWQLAGRLGIPYERGLWSGAVRVSRPPAAGSGAILGEGGAGQLAGGVDPPSDATGCAALAASGVPLTAGPKATLLADGRAAAPASAPSAVKAMIAAGNQIVGRPYVYGAGHGVPLSAIAPAYDCSSSVEHLLYGAGLLPLMYGGPSGELERFGAPGPGRWVTLYASADHVFMYVAGLRWDTHDAAGPGDGSSGIGWHPLIRGAAGFVVRHPVAL